MPVHLPIMLCAGPARQSTHRMPERAQGPVLYSTTRRSALQLLTLGAGPPLLNLLTPEPAQAGLVSFPANRLNNNYVLVRAGESVAESQGYVLSNPVSKTSMDSGLSSRGKAQVIKQTYPALQSLTVDEGTLWLWPSIAQNAYQTAEILAALCGVGRNRIVPEYSFLDARGVGSLERGLLEIVAADVARGDSISPDWRPPQGQDGTPNESVADVMVRTRQLLSITETQYLGDTILIISPDSANLSILQAAVLGMDLREHTRLRFGPGEVRQLQLSTLQRDDSPLTIPCPRPPQCR